MDTQFTKSSLAAPCDSYSQSYFDIVSQSFFFSLIIIDFFLQALIALRNFPTFAEFPLGMQQEIVKVGWYEKYQAQRVILRQGHRPLNFYFILSGSGQCKMPNYSSFTVDRSPVFIRKVKGRYWFYRTSDFIGYNDFIG